MSSVSDNSRGFQAPSTYEAVLLPSPSKEHQRTTVDSRSGISITVPLQTGTTPTPLTLSEKATPAAPTTTTTSTASTASRRAPLPRQNSSDVLDGYRSSCEGSVPEEGCHSSRESNSRSSSITNAAESCAAPQLSSQVLAELAKGGTPREKLVLPCGGDSEARSQALTNSGNNGGEEASLIAAASSHSPPPSHQHRHLGHSRPRSALGSAAREEERQRLIAINSPEASPAANTTAAAAMKTPIIASTNRSEGKSGRATAAPTPVSLAEASAADDSDYSSSDVVCHGSKPVFASTNVKTAAAMMSVALGSGNREGAASTSIEGSAASSDTKFIGNDTNISNKDEVSTRKDKSGAASGVDQASGEAPMRAYPRFVNSHENSPGSHTLSPVEPMKSPMQMTLSRLSRSSSNDSSVVEATMERAVPLVSTPTCRSSSLNPAAPEADAASNPYTLDNPNCSSTTHNVSEGGSAQTSNNGASPSTPVTALSPSTVTAPPATAPKVFKPVKAKPKPRPPLPGFSGATSQQASHSTSPVRTREKASVVVDPPSSSPATASSAAASHDATLVVNVASCANTSTNTVGLSIPKVATNTLPSPHLLTPTVDVSSSSSVGGHHLSVTEGNAFLKQSGSRREEAFYNMIQPYQEALVREAVRQAPHTVEHWRHQNATTSSSAVAVAAAQSSALRGREEKEGEFTRATAASFPPAVSTSSTYAAAAEAPAVIRHVHADVDNLENPHAVITTHMDDVFALCDARWEAYQQYEAEDMSTLDILASAPPPTTEREKRYFTPMSRRRSSLIMANSPVVPNCPDHPSDANDNSTTAYTPTPPLLQVDKSLVELAARLWWTIRFRHFYRTSSTAYEVQRQAAEAAGLSSPSPSTSSLAATGGNGGGIAVSRCSTPASQYRGPISPSSGTHFKEDAVVTPIQGQMPPLSSTTTAAAPSMVLLSGTATPNMMGSFAAPSPDCVASASNVSQSERQYSAQKHRALQLLAAFVPRYHGTRRLFVRDVLRCERRGIATVTAAPHAPSGPDKDCQNPLADCPAGKTHLESSTTATSSTVAKPAPNVAATPKIVDADDDDDEDDNDDNAGGGRICRMIMLEYVCYKFRLPCVMDVKMGSRQYGLHPTAEKKRSKERKAKLSTSGRYGIRLAGYRRWNAEESRYDFRSKLQCLPLTLTEVKNEVSTFMMNNRELERVFRKQLQRLRVAFSQQTVFRFYTSSLLFVYDAEDPLPTARVTMVDFAYTYESKELLQDGDPDADFAYDVGYLKAIDTLLSLLA